MSNVTVDSGPAPEAPDAPATKAPPPERLGKLAMRGSAYEILSFGTTNAVRLLGNLLLTRLLFPEAFGMTAILSIFNQGLVMLSDVGIAPGVVQSPRGDEVQFLNTAWTMHVVRGAALFLVALLLAWPVAWIYEDSRLAPLLAVGSLTVLISGFDSTSMMTLLRRVDSRRIMFIEVGSQATGLLVTIGGAWMFRSVWALVVGSLAGTASRMAMSHLFIDVGYKNRFFWSKESAQVIMRFGKWIFLSSAVMFFAQQIDRLFLGRFFGLSELGVYMVAVTFADLGMAVVTRLTHQILFPVFSRVFREESHRLQEVYYRARLAMDGLTLPSAGILFVLAPWIVRSLYDDRYVEAGWMLQVLVLRVTFSCIAVPCETCLFSMGHSHFGFIRSLTRLVWMLVALPLACHYFGMVGLVWVTAMAELPSLFVLVPAFARRGLILWRRELLVPLLFGAGVGLASLARLLHG